MLFRLIGGIVHNKFLIFCWNFRCIFIFSSIISSRYFVNIKQNCMEKDKPLIFLTQISLFVNVRCTAGWIYHLLFHRYSYFQQFWTKNNFELCQNIRNYNGFRPVYHYKLHQERSPHKLLTTITSLHVLQ